MTQDSNLQTLTLPVSGMDCGGCVRSVDKALRALPGVIEVKVSLESANAVTQFDPTRVTREAMVTAIEESGFDVPTSQP